MTAIPACLTRSRFIHAEDLLSRYPELPRKQRETMLLQETAAVFIIGIGWTLEDATPRDARGRLRRLGHAGHVDAGARDHGLNGDILVWNP